jgi:enoyl-CoA hydratase
LPKLVASDYEHLLFDYPADSVVLITMNRPDKYNAVNARLHHELAQVWLDIDRDENLGAAVITGAGKAFSAGGDLEWIRAQLNNFEMVQKTHREASAVVYNMLRCEKPIVSAINGPAVGAGLAVALVADISIINEDVQLREGHLRLGIATGDHAAMLWPLLCGMAKTRYYLLTCESLDGREAERIGLVSKCVPAEEVLPEALRVAAQLATGPATATRWTKRFLSDSILQSAPSFETSLALEMLGLFSADAHEGVAAVEQRRQAKFSARGPEHD